MPLPNSWQRADDHSIVLGQYSTIATYNAAGPYVMKNGPILADMVTNLVVATGGWAVVGSWGQTVKQTNVPQWTGPNIKSIAAQPARVTPYFNGQVLADGYWSFTWQFSFWTALMFEYFLGIMFGFDLTGQNSNAYSLPATAKTYTDPQWTGNLGSNTGLSPSPQPIYMNGYLELPFPGKGYTIVEGGYKDVKLKMSHGTVFTT